MGSDESRFVSLTVKDKVTRQCPQTTTFEGKAWKVDPGKDKSPAAPAGTRTRGLSITDESGVLTTELSPPAADVFPSTDDFRIDPRESKHEKGQNERLFILTRTHSMQIFGGIPFTKLQNDT